MPSMVGEVLGNYRVIIAGIVTATLAGAAVIFVMTRGTDEPAKPTPAAAPAVVAAPATPVVDAPLADAPIADAPVVKAPDVAKPRVRTKATPPPKRVPPTGLVTSPGKDPCLTAEGSPCEEDIGDLTRKTTAP